MGANVRRCQGTRGPVSIAHSNTRGDVVDVGERGTEWPEFVFVTARSGVGWVPARHLSGTEGTVSVLVAYDTTELPTVTGERLVVIERDERSGWTWCRNSAGDQGWVPDNTLDIG